jgi:diazepam-binding inhibitor (GABA receptor modulator, acyl-CoA-binding protein)
MPMNDLQTRFDEAAEALQRLPRRPDNETLLRLYALYKQGSAGDAQGKRPGILDPVGRAKFDAWSGLQGTPQEQAMQEYVELVERLRSQN